MSHEAFVQIVDAYYTSLFRFALSLTRSEADASDLTQQTFYVWATKGHALREAAKAKAWLFTTLYREFLRGRRRNDRMSALDTVPASEIEETTLEPEAVEKMDGSRVVEALQQIDEVFRAPLTLFYLQDFSYQEIAETLEVPIGTVMSRLSRGKAQLRALLANKKQGADVLPFPVSKTKSGHG